jgi:serine/threonine-protein kinase
VTSAGLLDSLRDQFGHRYAIERELGRGGMGAVYLARERELDRLVALKVLPPEVASDVGLRERFLRETRLVAGFSHPNIVPVFRVEASPTLLAFAMGFVEGESLTTRVQRAGPLTSREAVRLLQDIGYALAYAHGRGIVHRDLKPDNIMIERATGRALLMDFGIARAVDAPTTVSGLTRVGEIVGTPEFMSPEQISGEALDGRSDLYALGLVAHFALTGVLTMGGETPSRVLVKQLTEAVPTVGAERADLPPALVAVIDGCCAKAPADRFTTAEAMIEALEAAQLAAPEVATPVREFAAELSALPVIVGVGLIIIDLMLDLNTARGWSLFDGLTSITLVVAIIVARIVQVTTVRGRLRALGFEGPAVRAQLAQLLAERAAYRAALRVDAGYTRRERLVLAVGVLMLPVSQLLSRVASASRTQIGPMRWSIPPWAMGLFFLSSAMVGVGLVLIGRSPLLALGDRFFRALWLGPIGRLLWPGSGPTTVGQTVPPTPSVVAPPSTPPRRAISAAPVPVASFPAVSEASDWRAAVRDLDRRVRQLEDRTAADPSPAPRSSNS